MKKNSKIKTILARVFAIALAAIMVLSMATYLIYAIFGII